MPFGILDTKYIDLPANVDTAYLEGLRTRAGVDFPRILRELDSRLGAFNSNLDPLVASLITPTTDIFADTTMPTAFEVNERGEYTLARPQLIEGTAIMLPLRGYDVSMGFTEDGLESMSLNRIMKNIDSLLMGFKMRHRREAMKRLFSSAEVRVDVKTTVTSPGFAGSGTGDNVFSASYPDGTPTASSYSLYYRIATASLSTGLKTAVAELRKWNEGPFDLIGPQSQIDAIVALGAPDFISAGSELIRQGSGTAEAQVDANTYIGVFDKDVRVRKPINDFSTANIAIFKTFGSLNPQNPLAWRYDEQKGRNATVRSRSLYPLDQAVLKQDFGIGVNNRTAASLIYVAGAGNYTDPTFA